MKIATSILMLVMLSACSGTPTETHYYLLRDNAVAQSRPLALSTAYAMGSVTISSYLDRPGLILETNDGEVRPALKHQWAEPVQESIDNFLRTQISLSLGEDIFPVDVSPAPSQLEIKINQLHGTRNGEAMIVAYWWVRNEDKVISAHQFSETKSLNTDGYGALVEAERSLLVALAESIAAKLKEAN